MERKWRKTTKPTDFFLFDVMKPTHTTHTQLRGEKGEGRGREERNTWPKDRRDESKLREKY
jgi:hypothetical protein